MPRIAILYHYLYPDDVVSARLYDDLGAHLAAEGWEVTAYPSNRGCRDESLSYPAAEVHRGVRYRRVWRPRLPQSSGAGRLTNAGWLAARWAQLLIQDPPDVVLVGTDPILSVSVALAVKQLRPRVKMAHWVHDLYPEAAVAHGLLRAGGRRARAFAELARRAYRACDLIVDLGPCMREHLDRYGHEARRATVPPWATQEHPAPLEPDPEARRELFGGECPLGLLYSGSFGRAHSARLILRLAGQIAPWGGRVALTTRGNRASELRAQTQALGLENVTFAPFVSAGELARHFAAADVHLASLEPDWAGLVVPSKFFGALAAGRPVVYEGPSAAELGRWICDLEVGEVLERDSDLERVGRWLAALSQQPERRRGLFERCWGAYQQHFSRGQALGAWARLLAGLLN